MYIDMAVGANPAPLLLSKIKRPGTLIGMSTISRIPHPSKYAHIWSSHGKQTDPKLITTYKLTYKCSISTSNIQALTGSTNIQVLTSSF